MKEAKINKGSKLEFVLLPTIVGLEFAIPPDDKLERILKQYLRTRWNQLKEYAEKYEEEIKPYWFKENFKFTEWNGQPAYKFKHPKSPKKRWTLHLITEDMRKAWELDRALSKFQDEVKLIIDLINLSLWALSSKVYTRPKLTQKIRKNLILFLEELKEVKKGIEDWKSHKTLTPGVPKSLKIEESLNLMEELE